MLRTKFLDYIHEQALFEADDKILLTVSGGIDSVVMSDLFVKSNFKVAIAHCNFKLRGEESELDAVFVRVLAEKYALPYFEKSFDTEKYASQKKITIQEAARALRYQWFETLIKRQNFRYFATAHHFDDQIETFFINLYRGTGVKGLRGIQPKAGNCVRPLLFATRDEITAYARKQNLQFREDSSNRSDKYLRNRIRHTIIPAMESVKKDFRTGFQKTFELLTKTEIFIDEEISRLRKKIILTDGELIKLPISELKNRSVTAFQLYEILKPYGFGMDAIMKIPETLDKTGKFFLSETHQLNIDRDFLIISPLGTENNETFYINVETKRIEKPVTMGFEKVKSPGAIKIIQDNHVAQLDFDKLEFPLILRKWKKGDVFVPLGMTGRKKVSDFFSDEKFALYKKQNTWLLTSGKNIVWIVGHRIDNRFKIVKNTKTIYKITLK